MNLLRQKLQNNEKICGTLVSLTDPCLCEIMGNAGYDCVWIDLEHTYISQRDVLCHLNAARSVNMPAIVRVPQNDLTVTKQVLEMDVDGVVFPMSRSAEEARALIEMTLYPPNGTRGFGPLRAIRYGADDAKEYTSKKSLDICRFLQIEHIDFINDLEEILKIPYIDGFIFGPNDLSASLGDMLNVFGDKTVSEVKRATKILKEHGKLIGVACGMKKEVLEFWAEIQPDMIFGGADWLFVYNSAKHTFDTLESILKSK